MFPYTRYLRCLFTVHNRNIDRVSQTLRSSGITCSNELLISYYQEHFLAALPEGLRIHFHQGGIHALHPNIFRSVVSALDIQPYFNLEKRLPDLGRFDNIVRNRLLQRHIECSYIGRLSAECIYDDIKITYGIDVPLPLIVEYRKLFIDLSFIRDQKDWFAYMRSLPKDEQVFRNAIVVQPERYVRWKLGVQVHIDPQDAVKQIATDMFWKYKESLVDSSAVGLETTRRLAELAFKSIDRVVKLEAITKTPNKAKNFNALLLSFSEDNAKTVDEIDFKDNTHEHDETSVPTQDG